MHACMHVCIHTYIRMHTYVYTYIRTEWQAFESEAAKELFGPAGDWAGAGALNSRIVATKQVSFALVLGLF